MNRRQALLALTPAWPASTAWAHEGLGPITPRSAPPTLALTTSSGQATTLADLLRGRWTALQLMYTSCSSTCPVQGAVFAALQRRLAQHRPPQETRLLALLSVSISPLTDTPAALAAWLTRSGGDAKSPLPWRAAVPGPRHGDLLLDFLGARRTGNDRHSGEVVFFDPQGRFAYRCADLASAADLARLLVEQAKAG
ncbi:MAG: SCO family protein [Proteobacteria bacterium]|nr:SCO family protein [Pseudomonadota bacterium]